jgi:hypothetical protein
LFGLVFRRECPGIIRGAGTDSKSSTGIARWRSGSRVLRNRANHRYQVQSPQNPQESQDGGLDQGF